MATSKTLKAGKFFLDLLTESLGVEVRLFFEHLLVGSQEVGRTGPLESIDEGASSKNCTHLS